jgi:hypothetical protein
MANPDPDVGCSGTVHCRIVYPSATPDLRIRIRQWQRRLSFRHYVLCSFHPPIQPTGQRRSYFPGVKWTECEHGYSHPTSGNIRNSRSPISTPSTRIHTVLHRDRVSNLLRVFLLPIKFHLVFKITQAQSRTPTTDVSDKHLPLADNYHVVRTMHMYKYWPPVLFPLTVDECVTNQRNNQRLFIC